MSQKNNEKLDNVFSIAGIEVAYALSLESGGVDYITSIYEWDKSNNPSTIRLTGGSDMVVPRLQSMLKNEESKKWGLLVRNVYIYTNIGKIDAIIADAIDHEYGHHTQVIYPYQHADAENKFRVHRLKLAEVTNMNDQEKRFRMDQFFDGYESSEHYKKLSELNTNLSVDFVE